jgi:hypothetical protein
LDVRVCAAAVKIRERAERIFLERACLSESVFFYISKTENSFFLKLIN